MQEYLKGQVPHTADPQDWAKALLDHVYKTHGLSACGAISSGMLAEWLEAFAEAVIDDHKSSYDRPGGEE